MDFYIENKIIRFDKSTLTGKKIVGDNTDYRANFFFDDEWKGKTKTARFINNGIYKDIILDENDSCYIPLEVMKAGNMNVGVYAGNLATSTPAKVKITASILEEHGLPADPTPDVYAQIMAKLDNAPSFDPKGVVKSINGIEPDENGNVEIEVGVISDIKIAELMSAIQ